MSIQNSLKNRIEELAGNPSPRTLLSELRSDVKSGVFSEENEKAEAQVLLDLLPHEDAKTRKNAALLLGDLFRGNRLSGEVTSEMLMKALFSAYESEETKFVRASYLEAMEGMDVTAVLPELMERHRFLIEGTFEEADLKHIREERRGLERLLPKESAYCFRGFTIAKSVYLTCEESMQEAVMKFLGEDSKVVPGGVRGKISSWKKLQECRHYKEALFPIPVRKGFLLGETNVGSLVEESKLLPLLQEFYEGEGAMGFRLEVRSPKEEDRSGVLFRRFASEIEEHSRGRLQNQPSSYEFTIVLSKRREGSFVPYIKVSDEYDERFSYRRNIEPTSMAPVVAAEVVELIRPYLRPKSQVIDPFCGTGTLLIERAKALETGDIYGTDLYGHAILGGRENADLAKINLNLINRNFFDFKHDYPFDEILTEFPDLYDKTPTEKEEFFQNFFLKVMEILAENGILVFISQENALAHKHIRLQSELRLVAEIPFRKTKKIYVAERR